MRILHIITSLNTGGAEGMLLRLIEHDKCNTHIVIILSDSGTYIDRLLDSGIKVYTLKISNILGLLKGFVKLCFLLRKTKPNIVQTWMYHSDLLGSLAAVITRTNNIIWNIRGTSIPQKGISKTSIVIKICSVLSAWIPKKIVCCAEVVKSSHIDIGYAKDNMVVINNGYYITDNCTENVREVGRSELDVSNNEIIIGTVGRFDILKDYENFISSANKILKEFSNVKFLMVGKGLVNGNRELVSMIDNIYLDSFFLIGESSNVNGYLAAMDIYCMSSSKEGFPNAVCEAMLTQTPCVVTDAGDARNIVGNTGIVVPVRDSHALYTGLKTMINYNAQKRTKLGQLARVRIRNNYSINKISNQYKDLYRGVIK